MRYTDLLALLGPNAALLFDGVDAHGRTKWRVVHRSAPHVALDQPLPPAKA